MHKSKLHRLASEIDDKPAIQVYRDCAKYCEVSAWTIKAVALGHQKPSKWLSARIVRWSKGGISFRDLRPDIFAEKEG